MWVKIMGNRLEKTMKNLNEIIKEIKMICDEYPVIDKRITALRQAGYNDIDFKYLKQTKMILYGNSAGLFSTAELTRKKVYRIQVSQRELKKGYNAAWCIDVSMDVVEYKQEQPF
jgi:hypothetical protein